MGKQFLTVCAGALGAVVLAMPLAGAPVATEQLGGTTLTLQPTAAYQRASLRVIGPDGFTADRVFVAGEPVAADLLAAPRGQSAGLTALADGRYHYELALFDAVGEQRVHSGTFFAQNGILVSRSAVRAGLATARQELKGGADVAASAGPGEEGVTQNDFIFIVDSANDGTTHMTIGADNGVGDLLEYWSVTNAYGDFRIYECGDTNPNDGTCQRTVFAAPQDGDGHVGIGTTTPSHTLTISDDDASLLRLLGPGLFGTGGEIQFQDSGYAEIRNDGDGYLNIYASNRIALTGDGVGVGTLSPDADLHVDNADGSGDTVLKLAHPPQGSWNLGMTDTGVFTFNKGGTGGQEATFRNRNDATGATLEVQGSVKATNVTFPSSRALKTGFRAMDTVGVLQGVASLPMTSWRFKQDPESMVRFGPIAEDFQAAFGVGDGKTLSVLDVQGVSLAAIQALSEKVTAQSQALVEKEAEIDSLKNRLAAIEEKLAAAQP